MPKVLWLFGRSGAGKSTLAASLASRLRAGNRPLLLLDGDVVRHGLCRDLGFSSADRIENHRRIAEVALMAVRQGIRVLVATMAPEATNRDVANSVLDQSVAWVYIHAPLELCIKRDPKGLYASALAGGSQGIIEFPFELSRPGEALGIIDTSTLGIEDSVASLVTLSNAHFEYG